VTREISFFVTCGAPEADPYGRWATIDMYLRAPGGGRLRPDSRVRVFECLVYDTDGDGRRTEEQAALNATRVFGEALKRLLAEDER
jgi:hypothetical protein